MRNIFWIAVLLLFACNKQEQSNVSWSYFDGSTNKISDFDNIQQLY
jgi:hypothetical protein